MEAQPGPALEWSLMPVTFINWLISETHPFAPAAYKARGPGETRSQSQGKAERCAEFFWELYSTGGGGGSVCRLVGCVISAKLWRVESGV